MVARIGACLAMIAVLLLAGCASKPPAASAGGADDAGTAGPAGSMGNLWLAHPDVMLKPGTAPVQAAFSYSGPLNFTKTYTGTFAPQEVCPIGVCILGQQLHILDITDQLPMASSMRVTADLQAPGLVSPPFMLPQAPEGDRLIDAGSQTTATGAIDHFLIQHTAEGAIELWLVRGDEGAAATGSFTLVLTVEVLTTVFDPYTPVGVQVPAGATAIAVETATPGGSVRGWDAKDTPLPSQFLAKGFVLLPVTQSGEAVLQFTDVTATTRIYVLAPNGTAAPALRVLGFARTWGEAHAATGPTPVSWSFQADHPFGVGVRIRADPQVGVMSAANGDFKLLGPDGRTVASSQLTCICNPQYILGAWGAGALPGSYQATFQSTSATNVELTDFSETYQR